MTRTMAKNKAHAKHVKLSDEVRLSAHKHIWKGNVHLRHM
jgi:hypothetical protein